MRAAQGGDDSVVVIGLSALEEHVDDPPVLKLEMRAGDEKFDVVIRQLDPHGPSSEWSLEMRDAQGRSHIEDSRASSYRDLPAALVHALRRASETGQGYVLIAEDSEQLAE